MKTVVITGSARGLGFEMAKEFRKNEYNVVLSDLSVDALNKSKDMLEAEIKSNAKVIAIVCNVTLEKDLQNMLDEAIKNFGAVDIWINNAGVNQPMVPIWEVNASVVSSLMDVDLKGTISGSQIAMRRMMVQGFGQIYSVEGHGSNDAIIPGLSIYGTSKRAMTYFMKSLAKEVSDSGFNIQIGLLSPGIMLTNFTNHSVGEKLIDLPEKTKKIYNILGDYPSVIAKFLVQKMIANTKNDVRFMWLTNTKAFIKFLTARSNKHDYFNNSLPEASLKINYDECEKKFLEYVKQYEAIDDRRIFLKRNHSIKVASLCEYIAKSLEIDEEKIQLAKLIGLLHDIGRFYQIAKHNTFTDDDNFDHADYGVKILFEDGLIREFIKDKSWDDIICKAIANHNKYEIEKGLTEEEMLFAKILRDADKLDIFRICQEKVNDGEFVTKYEDKSIDEDIYKDVMRYKSVKYMSYENNVNTLIRTYAFVFDINYNISLKYLREKNYLNTIMNSIEYTNDKVAKKMQDIQKCVLEYIKLRIGK